jgi:hypothetical protein
LHSIGRIDAHSPRDVAAPIAAELFDAVRRLEEQACAVYAEFKDKLAEYKRSKGEGDTITDPKEVLDFLPPHRVTAGPLKAAYGHGYSWKLAFKPSQFPGLASLSHLGKYDLPDAVNYHNDNPNPEARALYDALAPLRARGFDAGVRVCKVTKSNVLCEAWCRTGSH